MEAHTERRSPVSTRVPVDLMVELSHEGDEDLYEADAVDLGPQGIGLRSALLPEIGQRLRCRFDVPGTDDVCVAAGEVVWADEHEGGSFGLRFEPLDGRAAAALEALTFAATPSEPTDPGVSSAPRIVRVRIDGVSSPVEGELDASGLAIEQPLPFLAIGRGAVLEVDGDARRVVLSNVRVRLDRDMPRLVLELQPEQAQPVLRARAAATSDATIQDESLDELLAQAPAIHDTPAELLGVDADDIASVDEAEYADGDDEALAEAEFEASLAAASERAQAREPQRAQARVSARDEDVPALVRTSKRERELMEMPEQGESAQAKLRVLVERAKPVLAKAGPMARKAGAGVVAGWNKTREVVGPWLLAAWRWIATASRTVASKLGERFPKLGAVMGHAPRRRTTAPPPVERVTARARSRSTEAPEAPMPMKGRGRVALVGLLAFLAIGMTAYGLSGSGGDEAETSEIDVHRTVELPPMGATPTLAGPVTVPEVIEPLPPPGPAEVVEPSGPLDAPSYPSIAARSESAEPETASSPSVAIATTTAFGAETVERGRTTTLRMSQPITGIRGEADESGFSVTILGALSLDRAAPIAAAHPSIERASILNRGDHSVLTIRFVQGRTPPYRIEAQGTSLAVTIGR